jgi:hypothetical protein
MQVRGFGYQQVYVPIYDNRIDGLFGDPFAPTAQLYSHSCSDSLYLVKRTSFALDVETEKVTTESRTDGHDNQFQFQEIAKPLGRISAKSSLIPNYNLKRTLFVYFYHRENVRHYNVKYPLSAFELKVLKKFLIKKLIQDKRKFKVLNIRNLTHDTYTDFLIANPAVYRKNIIKSKLFKKVVKLMKCHIPDFSERYIASASGKNLEVFSNFDLKKAYNLMTNNFYDLCLSNDAFLADFLSFINNPAIINSIVSESKRKFTQKVDGWIDALSQSLGDLCDDEDQSSLKVRLNSSRDEVEEARQWFLSVVSYRSGENGRKG